MNKNTRIQAFKYGIIGLLNTLLTAVVIWIMLRWVFGCKDNTNVSSLEMSIANICGYGIGVINSFICNRNWTFESKENWKIDFLKFLLAFGVCYLIQLCLVLYLNSSRSTPSVNVCQHVISSAYICQIIGIVSYTALNFFANKFYTFKS